MSIYAANTLTTHIPYLTRSVSLLLPRQYFRRADISHDGELSVEEFTDFFKVSLRYTTTRRTHLLQPSVSYKFYTSVSLLPVFVSTSAYTRIEQLDLEMLLELKTCSLPLRHAHRSSNSALLFPLVPVDAIL